MASDDPAIQPWEGVTVGQSLDVAILQVEITYQGRFLSDYLEEVASAKELVRNFFNSMAGFHKGKILFWDGDVGGFMFRVDGARHCDDCCLAAIEMLEAVPSLNQDIQGPTDLEFPIEVRLACDSGSLIFEEKPVLEGENFASKFGRQLVQVSRANCVAITERVFRQLSETFQAKFAPWKYSRELEVALYSTQPLQDDKMPPNPDFSTNGALPEEKPAGRAQAKEGKKAVRRPAKESVPTLRPRRRDSVPPRRMVRSQVVAVGLLIAILSGVVIYQAIELSHPPTAVVDEELINSPEWQKWRGHVRQTLSVEKLTDQNLVDALQDRPPSKSSYPADVLRHDAAIADVLLSYKGVPEFLQSRFGIYPDYFLGTGLSTPAGASNYALASVHEYLVPNLQDSDSRIWMRELPINSLDLDHVVSDIVGEESATDARYGSLKKRIISIMSDKGRATGPEPVIRFAILDENKYGHTLGKPERRRVFMSSLAEVWNLKLNDAALRSGYQISKSGDTLFVWIFLPTNPEEAVPATWGNVFDHLAELLRDGSG